MRMRMIPRCSWGNWSRSTKSKTIGLIARCWMCCSELKAPTVLCSGRLRLLDYGLRETVLAVDHYYGTNQLEMKTAFIFRQCHPQSRLVFGKRFLQMGYIVFISTSSFKRLVSARYACTMFFCIIIFYTRKRTKTNANNLCYHSYRIACHIFNGNIRAITAKRLRADS